MNPHDRDERDEREPEPIDTELPTPTTWSERAVAALANGRADFAVHYYAAEGLGILRGSKVRITLVDVAHDDDGLIVISRADVSRVDLFWSNHPAPIGTAAIYKASEILDADGRYPRSWDAWAGAVGSHRLRQVQLRWRELVALKRPAPAAVENPF